MTILMVPEMWYWKCGASQLLVFTNGCTDVDHRHPGSNVARPMVAPPMVINSSFPLGNVLTSSGFPLAGSEWVNTKGFERLTHIPLAGLNGPLTVEGKDWNLNMAPMGAALSDADLANVLTYIRESWGNQAGPVTTDEVKSVRAALGGRPQPLNAEKLKALAE